MALLDVQNLTTYYFTRSGPVKAVDNINFQVNRGEALGLVGESGCGKTTVALSILRILPPEGRIVTGKILYKGEDLVKLKDDEMRRRIRWKEISLVFQGAMNALHPLHKIEDQIADAILAHQPKIEKKEVKKRIKKLLEMVGIDPSRASSYPHELSGGMKQRVVIAMALACDPKLLIADELGTALDVIVQAQILRMMKELKKRINLGMIFISHDLSMVAEICEKCAVMYAGKIVEYGDIVTIFHKPVHPYTKGLIESFPNIKSDVIRIVSIPGSPPNLLRPPSGCRFHPRCPYAMKICKRKEPDLIEVAENHFVACHLSK